MMVGRVVNLKLDKERNVPGETVLQIENLTVAGSRGADAISGLSLDVHSGEIVGIAGVDGNGQSEFVAAIVGLMPVKSGRILLHGKDITKESIWRRNESGIGHIPEDRHKHGLVLNFRLDENLIIKNYHRKPYSNNAGFLQFKEIEVYAEKMIDQFDIRVGKGPATMVKSMSGGNQQKVIIARELDLSPSLLIVSQPTRGLDVGAIEYIHHRIVEERDKGRAVVLVSYELDEILALCDRIAALSKGTVKGIVDRKDADERKIGKMMAGIAAEEES
jgi:simple sugar transport system ATP-binding protein